MTQTKAYGMPTGAPILDGTAWTPPHYARADYAHRWAADTLRGQVTAGGSVASLPDMAGTDALLRGTGAATLVDDGGANPHVLTSDIGANVTDGTTHTSVWATTLTASQQALINTPGRVYGVSSGGVLVGFGTAAVDTTAVVTGWHVIALTSTPTGFAVWVDSVKVGSYTSPAGPQTRWALKPAASPASTNALAELVVYTSVLPDADVVAVSKAMMRQRGLS